MAPTIANEPDSFLVKAGRLVFKTVKDRLEKEGHEVTFTENDLDVIWFAKESRDWRILFRTPLEDGIYYRVTLDSVAEKICVDAFRQFDQIVLSSKELR